MALNDALERLQKRLEAGEMSQQEYEETKARLVRTEVVVSPLAKLSLFLGTRMKVQAVRGTVRTIARQEGLLTVEIDGRRVSLGARGGPPRIEAGDTVVMLVNIKDSVAQAYHNETTGSNDLALLHRRYRQAGFWAIGFTAVALAVFVTVFMAASHETLALPVSLLIHTPVYLLSILGGGVLSLIALFCALGWGVFWRTHETMSAIVGNDYEHALEQARRWLPEPKRPRSAGRAAERKKND